MLNGLLGFFNYLYLMEMESNAGKIPVLKKEEVVVHDLIGSLVDELQRFDCDFDERVLESIGNSVGFYSNDDKV